MANIKLSELEDADVAELELPGAHADTVSHIGDCGCVCYGFSRKQVVRADYDDYDNDDESGWGRLGYDDDGWLSGTRYYDPEQGGNGYEDNGVDASTSWNCD